MTVSPISPSRAAGPLSMTVPEPAGATIVYVTNRFPLGRVTRENPAGFDQAVDPLQEPHPVGLLREVSAVQHVVEQGDVD